MIAHTVPAPEAPGWKAEDVPYSDRIDFADVDVDHITSGLRDLGVEDTKVSAARELLSQADPTYVRPMLVELGATSSAAETVQSELERMQPKAWSPPGHMNWGKEPDVTWANLEAADIENFKVRRRRKVRDAVLEAFGFSVPVAEPHFEEAVIPILILAAPASEGAKVVWKATDADQTSGGFELTLLGSGLGENRTISIESSRTETCEAGDARLICLCAPVLAQPLRRRHKGGVEIKGYKRELARAGPGVPLRRFLVEHLDESELPALAGSAVLDEDRRNERASVELTDSTAVSGKRTLSVGIAYKDVVAKLGGTLEERRSYEVTSMLPGGYRYRRYYPKEAFGIMWELRTS